MSDVTGPASTIGIGGGLVAGGTLLNHAWGFAPYAGNLAPYAAQVAARVFVPVGMVLAADGLLELATGKSVIRGITGRSFNEHVRHVIGLEEPVSGVRVGGR